MSNIQDVKQATDIIQLISERVTLQRSGTNWRGLCPFHSEKSPSFFVSEQLQRYKCFGCGESGDVFTFLEKYEGMTFAEALEYLAERAGITLTRTVFSGEDDQRKRLLDLLRLAQEYYHYLLKEHHLGERARTYLKERGVTAESIRLFQIGYAPASWDGVIKFLHQKKRFSLADLHAAGLIVDGKNGRQYDRFRDRVMFPLTDHRGRVVGFSGRTLDPAAKEAKYINTPETMLYHKSQLLFGYSQLYQHLRKANEAIIVEGEFDVISSAQAHVNHVIAVKGSALTEDHMRLLRRTVEKVLLCFDTDAAGIEATRRAITVAKPYEIELRVLDVAGGDGEKAKDPDEIARLYPQKWREIASGSISVYEFLIRAAIKQHDPKSPEGKRHIVNMLAPIFTQMSHAVEREFYVRRLSELLQVKEKTLQQDLSRFGTHGEKDKRSERESKGAVAGTAVSAPKELTRRERSERYVAFLVMQADQYSSHGVDVYGLVRALDFGQWSDPMLRTLLDRYRQYLEKNRTKEPATKQTSLSSSFVQQFALSLADDLQQVLFDLIAEPEFLQAWQAIDTEVTFSKEWKRTIADLETLRRADQVRAILQRLDELDTLPERTPEQEAEQAELLRKVVELR